MTARDDFDRLAQAGDAALDFGKIDEISGNNGNKSAEANNGGALSGTVCSPFPESANGNSGNTNGNSALPTGYAMLRGEKDRPGLYYLEPDSDKPPHWICSPLHVLAMTRNDHGSEWGRLLEWHDAEDRVHRWAMPLEMTQGDGFELCRELVRNGLLIAPGGSARNRLIGYLVMAKPGRLVRCTDRVGWHGNAFALWDGVIGSNDGEGLHLQSERDESLGMSQAGTRSAWREQVAALAVGNSRLVFATSLAFAAPLARFANESGGFHLMGSSSVGKSTALYLAASVWGHPDSYPHKWRTTSNGLEGVCLGRNDLLLILDELAQVEPREAGENAYMIANGQGKVRATRNGLARSPGRWRTLFLSAGEIGLAEHMRQAGKQIRAGQEIRLVEIAADAGRGIGLFDTLHGLAGGDVLSQRLAELTRQQHGTAGRAFLAALADSTTLASLPAILKQGRDSFLADDVPVGADGQVKRVAGRFALVGSAGELATHFGLTGWPPGEATAAAVRLFGEWLAARGGAGSSEVREGIAAVRAFLEAHGESRFTYWETAEQDKTKTINRAGFRRTDNGDTWFYVLPEAFRREVCRGFNAAHVAAAMAERGLLKTDRDRKTSKQRMPGMGNGPKPCYLVTPAIWNEAEELHDAS
jgi:uncharacterized protein (DUF927 family)